MPRVRNMDRSVGVSSQERWIAPPSLPVREHAQVQHRGADSWPFLYSYRGDTIVVNKAQPKSKYQEASAVGFAEF
jgi:hypothetical protein